MYNVSGSKSARHELLNSDELPILWRLHQSDNTARNFAALDPVTYGYPTKILLGSAPTYLPGSYVTISGVVGATGLNGTHRVLYIGPGNAIAIDYDSGTSPLWSSGGSVSPAIFQDEFKLEAAHPIQGTVAGIWSNPTLGLTAHSAGTSSLRITTGDTDKFDLVGFRGRLVLGAEVRITSAPSGDETFFALGCRDASGNNTRFGGITMQINSSRQFQIAVRPRTVSDGGVSNTFLFGQTLTTGVSYKIAFILDYGDFPTAADMHCFVDGELVRSASITLTNATEPMEASSIGYVIAGRLATSLAVQGQLGLNGSGAFMQNLLWWKTNKSMTDTIRAVSRFHKSGSLAGFI